MTRRKAVVRLIFEVVNVALNLMTSLSDELKLLKEYSKTEIPDDFLQPYLCPAENTIPIVWK